MTGALETTTDAFLGGAGSLADVLVINGTVTGVTSIVVNDTNPGTGEENQAGILVVDVGTASAVDASNFVLAARRRYRECGRCLEFRAGRRTYSQGPLRL